MAVEHQLIKFNISLEANPVEAPALATIAFLCPNVTNLPLGGGRYGIFRSLQAVEDALLTGSGAVVAEDAAEVAFAGPRAPTFIIVSVDQSAVDPADRETYADAYMAFVGEGVQHFAVAIASRDAADQLAMASAVPVLNGTYGRGVFFLAQTGEDVTAGWPAALNAAKDNEQFGLVYSSDAALFNDVIMLASRLTFNWDTTAPAFTGQMFGGVPETTLSQSELDLATAGNVSVFAPFGPHQAYASHAYNAAGRPIEEMFSVYLFVNRLWIRLMNTKARYDSLGRKIPISTIGQAIVQGEIMAVFQTLQAAGHFTEGDVDSEGNPTPAIKITFPTDLAPDIAAKRISVGVELQLARGARFFELDLAFTTSPLSAE